MSSRPTGRRVKKDITDEGRQYLRRWFLEHFDMPYPSSSEKDWLAQRAGISRSQLEYWLVNTRKRVWTPTRDAETLSEMSKKVRQAHYGFKASKKDHPIPRWALPYVAAEGMGGCKTKEQQSKGSSDAQQVGDSKAVHYDRKVVPPLGAPQCIPPPTHTAAFPEQYLPIFEAINADLPSTPRRQRVYMMCVLQGLPQNVRPSFLAYMRRTGRPPPKETAPSMPPSRPEPNIPSAAMTLQPRPLPSSGISPGQNRGQPLLDLSDDEPVGYDDSTVRTPRSWSAPAPRQPQLDDHTASAFPWMTPHSVLSDIRVDELFSPSSDLLPQQLPPTDHFYRENGGLHFRDPLLSDQSFPAQHRWPFSGLNVAAQQ